MKIFKFTYLIFAFSLFFSSDLFGTVNDTTSSGKLIVSEGNWPYVPPNAPMPFCYNVFAPDFIFGFGVNINTAGELIPGYHPDMYATFSIDFPGPGPLVKTSIQLMSDNHLFTGMFNGDSIWGAYITWDASFEEYCPLSFEPVDYVMEITMFENGEYVPYPTYLFALPGDIFSAEIFDLTTQAEIGEKHFCCDAPTKLMVSGSMFDEVSDNSDSQKSNNVDDKFEEQASNMMEVFPNPFDDMLRVEFASNKTGSAKFEILDLSGRMVLSDDWALTKGKNEIAINTDNLYEGVYIIKCYLDGRYIYKKLVKSKL